MAGTNPDQPVNPEQQPVVEGESERRRSPLIAILILIAVLALLLYVFTTRDAPESAPVDLTPAPVVDDAMTPAPAPSAEKEPTKSSAKKKSVASKPAMKDHDASLVGNPLPRYPADARRANDEGTVVVFADVDAYGKVSDARIDKRSGSRSLDRAALAEVRTWTFRPAMKNGKTVASSVRVPVEYRIDESAR